MASLLLVNRTRANAEALASAFHEHDPPASVFAVTATDARSVARACKPDVAVIELEIAVGLRLVRDLCRMKPSLKVFIYGSDDDEREMKAWAEAGAEFIVMRSVSLADLVLSVSNLARGNGASFTTSASVDLHRPTGVIRFVPGQSTGYAELTQREHDVLRLIGLGFSNREVAETLCLELPTVKNHVQHLMRKLGVHRRTDAVQYLKGQDGDQVRREQSGAAA